jgi:diphosphomevalonate decarboxylase
MDATAVTHSNIALIKYWGKTNVDRNIPAVGSISVTLNGLATRTTVRLKAGLDHDRILIDGKEATSSQLIRASKLLNEIRGLASCYSAGV